MDQGAVLRMSGMRGDPGGPPWARRMENQAARLRSKRRSPPPAADLLKEMSTSLFDTRPQTSSDPRARASAVDDTEVLARPIGGHQDSARSEHLRWQGSSGTRGFCGSQLGTGRFIVLSRSAEHLVCPTCLAILRIYQKSGLWEGFGAAPRRVAQRRRVDVNSGSAF